MVVVNTQPEPYFLEDRSGAETDDTCGMKYWWNRLYGRRGIVAVDEEFYLTIGRETHEDMALIAEMEDIRAAEIDSLVRQITDSLTENDKLVTSRIEALYRRLGWLSAFALYVEPRIRAEYETVSIEAELILDRNPLWVPVTPDRLLRHREGGHYVYKEYKTTVSAGPKWVASWPFLPQPHLGLAAIKEEVGIKPAYCQIVGLLKGTSYGTGRLSHPYVWAWRNSITGEWTHDYDKARSAAWDPAPVWDYPGGVVEWVERCGSDVAISQFPHSAPVFFNERLLDQWITRRLARQEQIADVLEECRYNEEMRDIYFEARTKNCRPAFGEPCPFLLACHNAEINANPLASGLYKERTPHHEVEIMLDSSRG